MKLSFSVCDLSANMPKKPVIKPSVPLIGYPWAQLNYLKVKGSFWEKAREDRIPLDKSMYQCVWTSGCHSISPISVIVCLFVGEIETLFCKAEPKKTDEKHVAAGKYGVLCRLFELPLSSVPSSTI